MLAYEPHLSAILIGQTPLLLHRNGSRSNKGKSSEISESGRITGRVASINEFTAEIVRKHSQKPECSSSRRRSLLMHSSGAQQELQKVHTCAGVGVWVYVWW